MFSFRFVGLFVFRLAARAFLGLLSLPGDRAAVVGFNAEATVAQGMTGDRAALEAALAALPRQPGTRIDLGLAEARRILGSTNRGGNLPIVILLTDGRPAEGTADHPFSLKYQLFESGRWPIGIAGSSFNIF